MQQRRRKLTITVEDAVYRGLYRVVGRRNISRFLNDLARPAVVRDRVKSTAALRAKRRESEAELAHYVERMAGTAQDLDVAFEAASIEHLLATESGDN
ncbi:MAG: addiction module antitoxin [Candidatus Binataceae bacterium]